MIDNNRIAVILPCYRVKSQIISVLNRIDSSVDFIIVVDDCCPELTADFVADQFKDNRLMLIRHEKNLGVGGAMITGYREALRKGADIAVKVDGDGQIDPGLIPALIRPLLARKADYVKGNRFFRISGLKQMPRLRLFGNAILSFVNKVITGYWSITDPTNGFTAIRIELLSSIINERIEYRYFFESDMLFHCYMHRAVVRDYSMKAVYGEEQSGLNITQVAVSFPFKYASRFIRRLLYTYFIRGFSMLAVNLVSSLFLIFFGLSFSGYHWLLSIESGIPSTSGTVMIGALPLIIGFQLFLSCIQLDVANEPKEPICQGG